MSIKEDESSSKQDVNDPNDESAARDISIYKFTTTKKSQPKLEMMKDPDGFWGKSLDWVQQCLGSRFRINYTAKDVLLFILPEWLVMFRCKKRKRNSRLTENESKFQVFTNARNKLLWELDVTNVLNKIRHLESFYSLFLNKRQKFLLKYNKKNIVNDKVWDDRIEQSQSSSDDDFSQNDIDSNVNKKRMDTAMTLAKDRKLNDTILQLGKNQEITDVDKMILYGLLTKNPEKYMKTSKSVQLSQRSRSMAQMAKEEMMDKSPIMMNAFKIDKVEARRDGTPIPTQSRRQKLEQPVDIDSSLSEANAMDKQGSSDKTQKVKSIQQVSNLKKNIVGNKKNMQKKRAKKSPSRDLSLRRIMQAESLQIDDTF